jgi:hypothetical protein
MFAFNDGKMNSHRSNIGVDDFNFGLYHNQRIRNGRLEWRNYMGMGIQDYSLSRGIDLRLSNWDENPWQPSDPEYANFVHNLVPEHAFGSLRSEYRGYTFAASTELSKPLYWGCRRHVLRPFVGLDLQSVWQNRASETGDMEVHYADGNVLDRDYDSLIALDFMSATDFRVLGRYGFTIQRDGPRGYLRSGLTHSFLVGGRPYTSADNQFQFRKEDTSPFNVRGLDLGNSTIGLNFGSGWYLGKRQNALMWIDYNLVTGLRSTSHATQLGIQRQF